VCLVLFSLVAAAFLANKDVYIAGRRRSVSPAGNRCRIVLLDNVHSFIHKDESCPTADLSNIGRLSGTAYSTGQLLNTPLLLL